MKHCNTTPCVTRAAIAVDKRRITNISRRLAKFLLEKHELKLAHSHALAVVAAALGYQTPNHMLAVVDGVEDAGKEPAGGLIEAIGKVADVTQEDPVWMHLVAEHKRDPVALAELLGADSRTFRSVAAISAGR